MYVFSSAVCLPVHRNRFFFLCDFVTLCQYQFVLIIIENVHYVRNYLLPHKKCASTVERKEVTEFSCWGKIPRNSDFAFSFHLQSRHSAWPTTGQAQRMVAYEDWWGEGEFIFSSNNFSHKTQGGNWQFCVAVCQWHGGVFNVVVLCTAACKWQMTLQTQRCT